MDGKLVEYEKATVHFMTPALHYGTGVFEGIRCYNTPKGPGVFRLREHIERLIDSIHILGVREFPYTVDQLRAAVHETINANGLKQCYIRPLIYMANGPLGLNLDASKPSVGIAVWEWGAYLSEGEQDGIKVMISSFTRHHPNVTMTKAKVIGNYPNSVMAKTLALRAGFDEAIMLDPTGLVAECTGENLFMVRGNKLYTTPSANILEGITRDSVITMVGDLGHEVIEQLISRDQLYIADEVFLTGTAAECVAVREIDFRTIGSGKMGPVTDSIQKSFFATVHGDGKRSAEWLDYA